MVVSTGRGGLIAVYTFGCLLASDFSTGRYFHDERYYQDHGWPKLTAFLIAAAVTWSLSIKRHGEISATSPNPPLKDGFLRTEDALFFIQARYWPLILCALGVVFYFYKA